MIGKPWLATGVLICSTLYSMLRYLCLLTVVVIVATLHPTASRQKMWARSALPQQRQTTNSYCQSLQQCFPDFRASRQGPGISPPHSVCAELWRYRMFHYKNETANFSGSVAGNLQFISHKIYPTTYGCCFTTFQCFSGLQQSAIRNIIHSQYTHFNINLTHLVLNA